MECREVVGTVTQKWHSLLGEVGEGEFSEASLGQRLSCLGIEDLWIEEVFVEVGAVLALTLITHTRTGNLRESVDIVRLDAERLLQFLTHLLRPGLSTEDTYLQLEVIPAPLALTKSLSEEHGVAGGATEDGGTEIVHQGYLFLGVARRDGDDRGSDVRRSVMGTETSREESVAVGHLEDVILAGTVGGEGTGDSLRPHGEVLTGI